MFGMNSTKKITAKSTQKLSVKDIIIIIQACESSQVQLFELDSLKIHFTAPEKVNLVSQPQNLPENPSQDAQPKPFDSLQQEFDDLQLQASNPLAWEEKYLGQSE